MRSGAASVQALLIGAMAVWGLNLTVVKLLTTVFDPMLMASLRMLVACIGLTVTLRWRRVGRVSVSARQAGALVVCALLMVYANQILFAEGMQKSTATNAALIMALSPLVSSMMAALVFRERLTLPRLAGVALGFGGVAAVVLSHPGAGLSSAGAGDILIVASVISFAAGGVVIQRLARELPALWISWAIYLIGTALLVLHTAVGATPLSVASVFPGVGPWALVLFSGLAATAFGNIVWNQAIATIGVARTAIFLYWVPIFGVAFAALLLGEALSWWHLLGFVAVMGGTWLGTRRPVVMVALAS